MHLDKIKEAKIIVNNGGTYKAAQEVAEVPRAALPYLLELLDLFENQKVVLDKNSEYVRVKKKRYMLQKIKLQHKISDIRKEYIKQLDVLRNKRKKIRVMMDKQEDYDHLLRELKNKQLILDVTSQSLSQAEDGYDYLKQEVNYTKVLAFLFGIGFVFFGMWVFKMLGGQINIIY